MPHRFDKAEEWVPRFDNPKRDVWQKPEHVIEVAGIKTGMSVVDIGAGTGYFAAHLSRAVGESGTVLGLDVEPDMVRYMKERAKRESLANFEARVAKPDDPGLPPGSADRIVIVNTWHHITERERYGRTLVKALRSGGALVIVDFTKASSFGPPKHHKLSSAQVQSELEAVGMRAELSTEDLPHQYIVIGRIRETASQQGESP